MAVAFDAKATANSHTTGTGVTTISNANLTVGSGSNRALIAVVTWVGTGTPTSPVAHWDTAGTNQAMTQIGSTIANGTDVHVALFGLVAPTSGSNNFTLSWTGSLGAYIDLISFTGVEQTGGTTSFPNFNSATGTASPASVAITSVTGDYTVAAFGATSAADLTTLNQTAIYAPDITDVNGSGAANYAAGATSNTHSCTLSGTGVWAVCGCDVRSALTTFDPATLSSGVLSNGNRTLTSSSAGVLANVQSTSPIASFSPAGKVTVEAVASALGTGGTYVLEWIVGNGYFATITAGLALLGENGIVIELVQGSATGSPLGSAASSTITAGDVFSLDIDWGANSVQVRQNNSVIIGPVAFTDAPTTLNVYASTENTSVSGASVTSNFNASELAYTPPSGYVSWHDFITGGTGPVDITATIAATDPIDTFAFVATETPVWSLVGISEAAVTASGNYTLTEPAGCQQNDVLVVDFAIRSTVIYTNADWTFPQSDSGGNTTNGTTASDTSFMSGYCIRGSSAPTLVFSRTSGSRALGTIRAYRSSRTGTPSFDTSAKFGQTSASTTITLSGGITTAQDDELLTTGVFLARGSTANDASNMDAVSGITTGSGAKNTTTAPTIGTWIERSDRGNTTSPTVGLACYDGIMGTAGSTGNLSATAASSALNGMIVMAFQHPSGSTAYTLAGAEGIFSISGKAATLNSARKVAGAEGSFAISGHAAALSHGTKLSGAEGSFVISGQASAGIKALHVGGAEGSFVISGQAAALTYTAGGTAYTLAGGEGSFVISGQPATLNAARKMSGAEGAFVISGQAAGMLRGIKLPCNEGAFVISGAQAALNRAAHLSGAEGTFVISGQPGGLSHGTKLAAVEGSFVISGQSAQFPVALSMKGAEGAFVINGGPATLTYAPSGAPPPVHGNPFIATPGPMTTVQ